MLIIMAFTIRVGQHLNYISYGCYKCFADSKAEGLRGVWCSDVNRPPLMRSKRSKTFPANVKNQHQRLLHSYANDNEISRSFSLYLYYIFVLYFLISPLFVSILQWERLAMIRPVIGCRPGPHPPGARPAPRKLEPLKYRQYVPNVSEKTIGASGPSEGKIIRDSKKFREDLMRNLNPNIVFKDEERTNADRMMTERCKDRLDRLAIMVSEHWKHEVKLRVTEGWDEDGVHEENSLHYEGRAVDITTTDRDHKKYGMLARLAVEAGFDWVFYESRSHVHCSVKADKSDAAIYGGCFSGFSYLAAPNGLQIPISQVKPGDDILTTDSRGRVIPDKILTFLHWTPPSDQSVTRTFIQLTMNDGNSITLTPNHLIKVISRSTVNQLGKNTDAATFKYAKRVLKGDFLLALDRSLSNLANKRASYIGNTTFHRVESVNEISLQTGVFAPLTESGTVFVNGVLASCYAVIENHDRAHIVMSPMRYYHIVKQWLSLGATNACTEGISWYSKVLFYIASNILSETSIYV